MGKKSIVREIDKLASKLRYLNRYDNSIKGYLAYMLSKKKSNKITVYQYPDEIINDIQVRKGLDDVGIVLQGPVIQEDNFTLETINLFRTIYPDIKIVLSTWRENVTDANRERLAKLKCELLESSSLGDEYKGPEQKTGHLNNQILSSKIGMEYLRDNNVKYALKIRTDLRIYRQDFIEYLLNNMLLYCRSHDRKVINIAFSNSLIGVPFHMSDFIWFGYIDDMLDMYSVPFRSDDDLHYIVEHVKDDLFYKKHLDYIAQAKRCCLDNLADVYSHIIPDERFLILYYEECYLAYMYAKTKKYLVKDDLYKAYEEFLTHKVVVLDEADFLVFWNKYLYSTIKYNYAVELNSKLTHSQWLNLYLK